MSVVRLSLQRNHPPRTVSPAALNVAARLAPVLGTEQVWTCECEGWCWRIACTCLLSRRGARADVGHVPETWLASLLESAAASPLVALPIPRGLLWN